MNEVHTSTCYIYIQGSRVVTRQSSRPLTTNDNEAAAVASGPVAAGGSPDSGSEGGLNGGERERRLGQSANELAGTGRASFGHHTYNLLSTDFNLKSNNRLECSKILNVYLA